MAMSLSKYTQGLALPGLFTPLRNHYFTSLKLADSCRFSRTISRTSHNDIDRNKSAFWKDSHARRPLDPLLTLACNNTLSSSLLINLCTSSRYSGGILIQKLSHLSTSMNSKENKKSSSESEKCTGPGSGSVAPGADSGLPGSDLPTQPLSKAQRLKQAIKDYGSTVLVFHISMSLCSLGFFYVLVSSGLDMVGLLERIGVGEKMLQSTITQGASTFVVAYAVHKVFAPVRITITLTVTPIIVKKLRTMGILKGPKVTTAAAVISAATKADADANKNETKQ